MAAPTKMVNRVKSNNIAAEYSRKKRRIPSDTVTAVTWWSVSARKGRQIQRDNQPAQARSQQAEQSKAKRVKAAKKIKSTNPWSGSMYRTTELEARFKAGHGLNNGYDGLLEIIRAAIDNPELTGAACAGDWRRWTCRYLED